MRCIGKYPILGLLGRGGMGAVYKAQVPVVGRVVALKLLRPQEPVLDLWGRERVERVFRDEAVLLGSLRHTNVVDVFDYGQADGWPYFVMEFYGESLGSVMGETYRVEEPSRRLPVARAVSYARQLLRGLARLHYAGVVHRDVKPFNLLVTDDDVVKLTDLGLSKVRGERFRGPANLKVGSPYYAAPEQEDDPAAADERSDLYAVGVTVWRMLTGLLPEPDRDDRPSRLAADLDEAWDAFLWRATHQNPAKRFGSAQAMLEALDTVYDAWRRRMDRVCAGAAAGPEAPRLPPGMERPRREPVKVSMREARQVFGLDALWRPRAWWPGRLEDVGDGLLRDPDAGLVWEREAAPYPLPWEGAKAHVAACNAARRGGYADWRLPTVAELVTLLSPAPQGQGYCQAPVLRQPVRRVWSADRATFTAAWAADVELGYVARADCCCPVSARAVRSL